MKRLEIVLDRIRSRNDQTSSDDGQSETYDDYVNNNRSLLESNHETHGDVSREETYDNYVHQQTSQPESKWQARMAFMKKNKVFMVALIIGAISFGALVVGLSVGLTTRVTTTVPSQVIVMNTRYGVKAQVLLDGFGLSKAGVHKNNHLLYDCMWIPEISKLSSRIRPELRLITLVQLSGGMKCSSSVDITRIAKSVKSKIVDLHQSVS